jgi:hypothetical protein
MKALFRASIASSVFAAFFAVAGESHACDPTKPIPWKVADVGTEPSSVAAATTDPTKPIPWRAARGAAEAGEPRPIPWK